MLLKKIKLENIRSYDNAEIEFPAGSTLLSGDIGTGKTSVLLAVEFALFGLQPNQKGSSLLKNDKNHGSVMLEMESDGQEIIIERILKRKKSVTQDSASITINNKKKQAGIQEIKNVVLQLLSYPPEFAKKTNLLYRFTVYTPQEEMKQIILEKPDIRLDTLRHIFGIDRYKKIKENTNIIVTKLRAEIRNIEGKVSDLQEKNQKLQEKNKNISQLESRQKRAVQEFELATVDREKSEQELEKINSQLEQKNKLQRDIDKSKLIIQNKKDNLVRVEKEISQLQEQLEIKVSFNQDKLTEIKQKIEKTNNHLEQINKAIMEITSKLNSLESKKSELSATKEKISKLEKCPTCLQNVNVEYKKNISYLLEKQLNETETEIENLANNKKNQDAKIENLNIIKKQLESEKNQLELLKIKVESLKEKQTKLEQESKNLEAIKKDINTQEKQSAELNKLFNKFADIEQQYEQKKQQHQVMLDKEKQKEIQKATLDKEILLVKKEIEELSAEIEKKQKLREKVSYMKEVEDWLSEKFLALIAFTEKNVMLKLREEFSKLFNEWFCILVADSLSVRLDEEFTPVIEQQGYEIDYQYLSGGERTAVALAYRLALNQTINSLLSKIKTKDIVILDEPTDGFSEQQLDKMRDVLHQLNVKQLILVSHESKIEGFVDNIIRFKKEAGITKVF